MGRGVCSACRATAHRAGSPRGSSRHTGRPPRGVAYYQHLLYTNNMSRHPHKEIRKALAEAEAAGLTVAETSGHTWGYVSCSCGRRIAVYSTGRNPEHGAKLIRGF